MVANQNEPKLVSRLDALAQALEGQGQYNVAKLVRAVGASLVRSSAHHLEIGTKKDQLAEEVRKVASELGELQFDAGLIEALLAGAMAIEEDRLPLIEETPHPYICRTCGRVELAEPLAKCPRCNARPRTFQRFPPVYWLEAMDPMETLEYLEQTPQRYLELIEGRKEDQLSREVVEGEWSVRQLLTHLRDAQGVLDFRVNLLLEQDYPKIESKAVFAWAADNADRPTTSRDIFESYLSSRKKTLEVLEGIPLVDWWREGEHEEFGVVSVKEQASYFATHELIHLPQLERLLGELDAS